VDNSRSIRQKGKKMTDNEPKSIEEIKDKRRRELAREASKKRTAELTALADKKHEFEEMHDRAYQYFYRKTCERIVQSEVGGALSITVKNLCIYSRTVVLGVNLVFENHKPIGFLYDANMSLTGFTLINKSVDSQTVADHYQLADLLIWAEEKYEG
jgi:hypothetical protein